MITLYLMEKHPRCEAVISACKEGLEKAGHPTQIRLHNEYICPESDIAVFYGYFDNGLKIMEEYKKAIYIDLGYFPCPGKDSRFTWYHKVSVNSRHPIEYFQRVKHPDDRFKRLDLEIKPWQMGENILLTGMSGKGARAEGYGPSQWEDKTSELMFKNTSREIIYRPKPNWLLSRPVNKANYANVKTPLKEALVNLHALVAHHSNCAIEALIKGIPTFVLGGCAKPLSSQNFANIDNPYYPEDRYQWASDLAYTQFTTEELASRLPWDILCEEGVI